MNDGEHRTPAAAQPTPGALPDEEERWLVLVLDAELGYAVLPGDPGTELVLGGRRFVDAAGAGFNWFADRLFDGAGRCVGFELDPLIPLLQDVPESIARLPYVEVIDTGIPRAKHGDRYGNLVQLRIFFGAAARSPVELRGSQAFLGRVFADDGGGFALAFDPMLFLDAADIDGLSALGVRMLSAA